MSDSIRVGGLGERALAETVAGRQLPDMRVSPRTQTTYEIGATAIIKHLISGDWEVSPYDLKLDNELMGEFVKRVVANAARQGIIWEDQDGESIDDVGRDAQTGEPDLETVIAASAHD